MTTEAKTIGQDDVSRRVYTMMTEVSLLADVGGNKRPLGNGMAFSLRDAWYLLTRQTDPVGVDFRDLREGTCSVRLIVARLESGTQIKQVGSVALQVSLTHNRGIIIPSDGLISVEIKREETHDPKKAFELVKEVLPDFYSTK